MADTAGAAQEKHRRGEFRGHYHGVVAGPAGHEMYGIPGQLDCPRDWRKVKPDRRLVHRLRAFDIDPVTAPIEKTPYGSGADLVARVADIERRSRLTGDHIH